MQNKKTKQIVFIGGIIILVALAGYLSFKAYQAKYHPNEIQVAATVEKVKRHMVLPTNETPFVARVKDVDQLKTTQPFFADAQNGDILLVYKSISKAIIYSESKDLIVNVGPLVNDATPTAKK